MVVSPNALNDGGKPRARECRGWIHANSDGVTEPCERIRCGIGWVRIDKLGLSGQTCWWLDKQKRRQQKGRWLGRPLYPRGPSVHRDFFEKICCAFFGTDPGEGGVGGGRGRPPCCTPSTRGQPAGLNQPPTPALTCRPTDLLKHSNTLSAARFSLLAPLFANCPLADGRF